jgi:hypothetical protein
LNLDTAAEALKLLGAQLEALDKGFFCELVDAFAVIAAEYSGDAQEVVRISHMVSMSKKHSQPTIR